MSKTSCIVPWSTLVIGPDGRVTFCCDVPEPLRIGGREGSVYRDSFDELWNAEALVGVRAAMARGEKPASCRVCWEREAAGGVSRRLLSNTVYRQLGGTLPVETAVREGAASGFRLERRPDWFILQLGNTCSLKCRSCSPLYSSRIAADPLHAAWAGGGPDAAASASAASPSAAGETALPPLPAAPRRRLQLAPEGTSAWFEDVDSLADMIAAGAERNALLSLMGGEPFLIDRTWRLLEALVERGVAPRLIVALATNGQHRRAELEHLAPLFRGFNLSLSIDGHGRLYELLRHGASWAKLVENLRWFRQIPKLDLSAVPTMQNANALDMVPLLRFLDEQELRLAFNVLVWPARLRPANLPPSVRRIAARRLHGYLETECRPENLAVVRGYCEALEEGGDDFDGELFAEFMAFTEDLDAARCESLRAAAPELVALVRAAGVDWPRGPRRFAGAAGAGRDGGPGDPGSPRGAGNPGGLSGVAGDSGDLGGSRAAGYPGGRPGDPGDPRPMMPVEDLLPRINRTIAARDALFAGFEAAGPGAYFSSAARQLADFDELFRAHGHRGLAASGAVADFACHYGRVTRALRAALPHAAVYACDIDPAAVKFCADELGALPVALGWRPDEESLPGDLDAVLCVSLLTHTPLDHWRRVLRAWERMLRPGGVAAFTYLSARHHLAPWRAGEMAHYGSYSPRLHAAVEHDLSETGFGFAPLTAEYGGEPLYGIAFADPEVVRREIAAAGLELLALPSEVSPLLAQDLAVVRKPGGAGVAAPAPEVRRDVTVVALYDPRCYAPGDEREGSAADSAWARLAAARPATTGTAGAALPTELGFGDPRVAEVRAAQAALAREHGVDAFCYRYPWGADGPRWDAPWRDLVASGEPDFPFCLLIDIEDGAERLLTVDAAGRLFDGIARGLGDRRYLRVEGRPLLVVRDVARLAEPARITREWRAAATAAGLGGLHLCAVEPVPADCPADLGFDSFLAAPPPPPHSTTMATTTADPLAPAADPAARVAAALARPWPPHRLFRVVECRRGDAAPHALELYEHWLRSAAEATRRRGEALLFVDAWNDWPRGLYLEPDDRDGRAALLATRRAVRGPASGLVLLRQLRERLGDAAGPAAPLLAELGQVLALHEHTRDRLLASVEAALGRVGSATGTGGDTLRWISVPSRQLPPSGGGFCLDRVGSLDGAHLRAPEPIVLRGNEVSLAGWAHTGEDAPGEVHLFLALEAVDAAQDRLFRVAERRERTDVVAAFPEYPTHCGFDTVIDLLALAPGEYHVAIVQRTPRGVFRDATGVNVRRDGAPCSSA